MNCATPNRLSFIVYRVYDCQVNESVHTMFIRPCQIPLSRSRRRRVHYNCRTPPAPAQDGLPLVHSRYSNPRQLSLSAISKHVFCVRIFYFGERPNTHQYLKFHSCVILRSCFYRWLWVHYNIHCEPKTHQNVFVISSTKPGQFWQDLVCIVLSKFAIQSTVIKFSIELNRWNVSIFHLTWIVSTLPCQTSLSRFAGERQLKQWTDKTRQNVFITSSTQSSRFW